MNYIIRQISSTEYQEVRMLDSTSFGKNERGSNADEHKVLADNIRKSPYYLPELDLIAVEEGELILGHAIFSSLPMGDDYNHAIWLNSLAIRHDETDNHVTKQYRFQRKGIGTVIVQQD
jgi:Predicted acetyltransferase